MARVTELLKLLILFIIVTIATCMEEEQVKVAVKEEQGEDDVVAPVGQATWFLGAYFGQTETASCSSNTSRQRW